LVLRILAATRGASIVASVLLALISTLPMSTGAQDINSVPAVWVATHKNLQRIDLDTNQIGQTVTLDLDAKALVVDPADGNVWVLTQKRLSKLDNNGRPVLQIDLTSQNGKLDDPRLLALDPYDSSLWVAGEKLLLHLDAQGKPLQAWEASDEIQAISLDIDESLWLLSHSELLHLSAQSTVLQRLDLKQLLKEPEFLALDNLGALLWIAGKQDIIQLELNRLDRATRYISLPDSPDNEGGDENKVLALSTDPVSGNLWLVTKDNHLFIYDRDGNLLRDIDTAAYDLSEISQLAFEPVSTSFWLGGEKSVDRFNRTGDFIARVFLDDNIDVLGVTPFHLAPALTLLAPPDDGFTNNPRTPIRLGLGSSCNAIPCTLADSYTAGLSLDVNLNGQAISQLFSQTGDEAQYLPPNRLPEGPNILSAQASDRFGHSSERISGRFTIDTIPPRFLGISPADGSTLTTSTVTIQGTLDDPTASVMLLDNSGNVLSLASGSPFGFALTLEPGLNIFTLMARDPAGNVTSTPLKLNFSSGPNVTVTSIASGATVSTDSLFLTGNVSGPENTGVTVNGVIAVTVDGKFYVNNIPLQPGSNTLTVVATTPDGQTITQTLTVTSAGPSPFQVTVEPQSGVTPLPVAFTVTGQDPSTISQIAVDFDGNGTTDFTATDPTAPIAVTYPAPGVYQPKITVTDSQGSTFDQSLVVVVYDATQMDRLFGAIWNGMNSALQSGDAAGASHYLNASAKLRYIPVFSALLPNMPQIIASYSPLKRVSISENIGEYAINRTYQGENRLYLIYFLKDADGVWRVDAM